MLDIGRLSTHDGHKISRRAMMQAGSLGAVGWSLADLLRCDGAEPVRGPAKSVILLAVLWGGPSHLDTFDLKPKAPLEYRGVAYRPIATSAAERRDLRALAAIGAACRQVRDSAIATHRLERSWHRRHDRADRFDRGSSKSGRADVAGPGEAGSWVGGGQGAGILGSDADVRLAGRPPASRAPADHGRRGRIAGRTLRSFSIGVRSRGRRQSPAIRTHRRAHRRRPDESPSIAFFAR